VRIGSGAGLSEGIILAVINRLSRLYPRVVFHVAIGTGTTLHDQLRERNIELGFVRPSGLVRDEDIDLEVLFEEPLVVVAGADNPWVRRRNISLAELVNEPWTWPPPESVYDSLVVEAFRASGLEPPRPAVYTHAVNLRISLAATGPFLAVVAAGVMSLPSKYPSIRMLPVELPTTHRAVGIVTLKKRALSPLARIFVDCVRDVAKPLTTGWAPSRRAKKILSRKSQT
jgi:DNA-binding transcriptional LysR family regulator